MAHHHQTTSVTTTTTFFQSYRVPILVITPLLVWCIVILGYLIDPHVNSGSGSGSGSGVLEEHQYHQQEEPSSPLADSDNSHITHHHHNNVTAAAAAAAAEDVSSQQEEDEDVGVVDNNDANPVVDAEDDSSTTDDVAAAAADVAQEDEEARLAKLAAKLQPVEFKTVVKAAAAPPPGNDANANNKKTPAKRQGGYEELLPHQFLHLHHMKTGGTSMDGIISCGMRRLRSDPLNLAIPYANIHECSQNAYRQCVAGGPNNACRDRIANAAILSYCAPLKDLADPFDWRSPTTTNNNDNKATIMTTPPEATKELSAVDKIKQSVAAGTTVTEIRALTVLRRPVARVWSMFRFQTKGCYQCQPLLDVYRDIDAGNSTISQMCRDQLMNHQTRNMLDVELPDPDKFDQALIDYAIENMESFFTMIGLTEDMTSTAIMAGLVFPWLNETVAYAEKQCPLGHKNASPKNNRCGKDHRSHWDLPDEPDDATTAAIIRHNQMDVPVYEAAVELFARQKQALGLR